MKICCVRLDKIGDLVLTLPIDQLLKPIHAEWVIAQGLEFVAQRAMPPRDFVTLDLKNPAQAKKRLAQYLHDSKPDLIVFFYGPAWAAKTISSFCRKNSSYSFGRYSQWYSWFLFSSGLRQTRSLGEKHETDYNQELLEAAMNWYQKKVAPPILSDFVLKHQKKLVPLKLKAPPLRHLFEKHDLKPKNYIVVHPGMAGSALNWPLDHYRSLIQELQKNHLVVLTGTTGDSAMLDPLIEKFGSTAHFLSLKNELSSDELLFILENAKAVVAPSTGVAHLAASLNTKTIGIYSPVASQHPRRWAALGEKVQIFVPTQHTQNCMQEITVAQILESIEKDS